MTQLYKVSGAILKLQTEEDQSEDWVKDTLESLEFEFDDKAENIIKYAKNLKAEAKAFKDEAESLNERAKQAIKTRDGILNYLLGEMVRLDKNSLKFGVHGASVRKGLQVANIIDSSKIPDDYCNVKTEITADKKAVLKALKEGKEVSGAEIKTNPSSITIK